VRIEVNSLLAGVCELLMEVCLLRIKTDTHTSHSTPTLDSIYHCYVIHCKSGKEKTTSEALKATLGLSFYLPEKKIWRKGNACFIPLFPGYFFVQADLQKTSLSRINTSPGVLRLLECEGIPQAVPSHLVETLRAEMTRLNEYHSAPNQGFRPGDTMYMTEGPLRGLESVFIGPVAPSKRVQVLLKFLGRLTKAEVEVSALEKRTENIKPERVRYTRGKGRKVCNQEMKWKRVSLD
jgi:transcriptional antiterminator RfaH